MKFICTGKGFVAGIETSRDSDNGTIHHKILYTDRLREAQLFSKVKTAVNFLDKYKIEGFVYSPKAEEHELGEKKYIVKNYTDPFKFYTDKDASMEDSIFKVVKVLDWGYSDLDFLNNRKKTYEGEELMIEKEAVEECIRRNNLLIEKLKKQNEINSTRRFD